MVMTLSFCRGDLDRQPRPREAIIVYGQSEETRTVTDEKGIDFLSFPREIRDTIYAFIFVKPTFIGAETKFTKPFYKDAISWRNLDFAGSCRQIWNESLKVYLAKNGFEFFYIRPFLEFLEKIGILGRRLLQNIRWHHRKRSHPFIVLRYLRSCTALQTLKIFARVAVQDRKKFWWGVPLLNAKRFFLSDHTRIKFGTAQGFGKGAEIDEEPPNFGAKTDFGERESRSLATLTESLMKVNYDLPDITENGMCHWKYKMIDEKKAQMRAEVSRQEEEARSEHTGNGQAEASANAQETDAHGGHENVDNEMIDEDDGYVVQDGNLTKDGVIVASGAVFETGFLLEDGRQVEDSAGDDVDSNGEDASMGLDDEPAENSEVMLWEP